jgi:hypothetical protein
MRLQDYVTFDRNGQRLLTLTLAIPQAFYSALAQDLGRRGDLASDPEVLEYLREVIRQNLEHVIESNKPTSTSPSKSGPRGGPPLRARRLRV